MVESFLPAKCFLKSVQDKRESTYRERRFQVPWIPNNLQDLQNSVDSRRLAGIISQSYQGKQLKGFFFLVVACHSVEIRHYHKKSEQLEQKKHTLK
jgi:hypothetical protein